MSAVVSLFITAKNVGHARAWVSEQHGDGMFNIELDRTRITIGGQIDAAVALRDALNTVIDQAEALTGGGQ